jgi:hypothetical protein
MVYAVVLTAAAIRVLSGYGHFGTDFFTLVSHGLQAYTYQA